MIFYHVAPRKYRDKILNDGLKSEGSVRKHNEYPEEVRDWITSKDVVYLIWDLDKWFSYTNYTEPTDIWKVNIKNESKLIQDSGHYIYPDGYYEDPNFDKKDLIEDLKEWKWTAEDAGTAAHIGDIPPSQIKLMTTVSDYLNENNMKLTEDKLRSLIREELIKEVGFQDRRAMQPKVLRKYLRGKKVQGVAEHGGQYQIEFSNNEVLFIDNPDTMTFRENTKR